MKDAIRNRELWRIDDFGKMCSGMDWMNFLECTVGRGIVEKGIAIVGRIGRTGCYGCSCSSSFVRERVEIFFKLKEK